MDEGGSQSEGGGWRWGKWRGGREGGREGGAMFQFQRRSGLVDAFVLLGSGDKWGGGGGGGRVRYPTVRFRGFLHAVGAGYVILRIFYLGRPNIS